MQIEAIELFHLKLDNTDAVLVRLESAGQSGWGEVCLDAQPIESSEWAGSAFACLRDILAPTIKGQAISSGEQLQTLLSGFQGNHAARSALDGAWWDLNAKLHSTTVAALIGGSRTPEPPGLTLGVMPTIDELLAAIEKQHSAYPLVLLKFRPGWDEQMLRAVRQTFPSIPLAIDCDGCCQFGQRELLYRLDDFMLRWIEQPFAADDLVAHAMLQEQIRTPICLHQSITSPARVEQALDLQSGRMLKIDPALVGGLTPAIAIHQQAQATGLPISAATRYATTAGQNLHEALATLPNFTAPTDTPTSQPVEITPRLLTQAITKAHL